MCVVDENGNSYLLDPTCNDGVLNSDGYMNIFDPTYDNSAIGSDGHIREDLFRGPALRRKDIYGENVEGLPDYFTTLKCDKSEILEARKKVYDYSLKKYSNHKLFRNYRAAGKTTKERVLDIAKKISEFVNLPEGMECYDDYDLITVNLDGFEMEVGKCFELLLYANNIEFSIAPTNPDDRCKKEAYLHIKDGNYECVIKTNNVFSIDKRQKKWFAERVNEQWQAPDVSYIFQENPEL